MCSFRRLRSTCEFMLLLFSRAVKFMSAGRKSVVRFSPAPLSPSNQLSLRHLNRRLRLLWGGMGESLKDRNEEKCALLCRLNRHFR